MTEEGLNGPDSTQKMRKPPSNAWLPGQSGNPGGRVGNTHVRELARQHTEEAIATLAAIMVDDSVKASARVAASEALLDRAWGKPTQHIEHTDRPQEIQPMDEVERRLIALGRLPAPVPAPATIAAIEEHMSA